MKNSGNTFMFGVLLLLTDLRSFRTYEMKFIRIRCCSAEQLLQHITSDVDLGQIVDLHNTIVCGVHRSS